MVSCLEVAIDFRVSTLIIIHNFVGGKRSPSATIAGKASLAGANKIQAGSLCYFTPSRGCRGFAEIAPGCPPEIARHSGKQCSIGLQPVLFAPSSDAFQVSSVSPICVQRSGLKPRAESSRPLRGEEPSQIALIFAPFSLNPQSSSCSEVVIVVVLDFYGRGNASIADNVSGTVH